MVDVARGGPVTPGGFDAIRPPDQALIDVCVHCGFCLPTCPTYVLWGEEMDSPRGRIVLMDEALAGRAELEAIAPHLDACLGCMACVTSCPSGVRFDRLIEAARPQRERNARRPLAERLFRRGLFALATHPGRLRAVRPLLGLSRLLHGSLAGRVLGRFPRLEAIVRLAPERVEGPALPALVPARGVRRGRVGLLQGCVQRVLFGGVNAATARVLAAERFDVVVPSAPRCCGALQLHAGEERAAMARARETISAFEGCDLVAVNAAGCGSAMKEYGELLSDDPRWRGRAEAFAARVRDVHELLAEVGPVAPRHPVPMRLAYHDACHLAHAQHIRSAPRSLLASIPGLELLEPDEWELCCGSAGVYNVLQPAPAAELGRRKARNLLATGAEAIAAANPGCAMQIQACLREAGRPLPVYHPMEILDASIRSASLP
jgi:glycolate oxidase iron-sulfur subunit